jgi:transposase
LPLVHRPGEEAQVDFFEVMVEIGGESIKAWEFLLQLMYSVREFAWLYERCDQLAFLDGHVRAFSYLDGVVKRRISIISSPPCAESSVCSTCCLSGSPHW